VDLNILRALNNIRLLDWRSACAWEKLDNQKESATERLTFGTADRGPIMTEACPNFATAPNPPPAATTSTPPTSVTAAERLRQCRNSRHVPQLWRFWVIGYGGRMFISLDFVLHAFDNPRLYHCPSGHHRLNLIVYYPSLRCLCVLILLTQSLRSHMFSHQLPACDVALGYTLLVVGATGKLHSSSSEPLMYPQSDAGVHDMVSAYLGEPTTSGLPPSLLRLWNSHNTWPVHLTHAARF
jgi:hypothetical protein